MNKDIMTSRRALLAGVSATAAAASLGLPTVHAATPKKLMSMSGLGGWYDDLNQLPSYVFTADVPLKTLDAVGKPYPLAPDPFFILGNYRLTVFPSVSGLYRLVSGERGWTRLNEPLDDKEQNAATLEVTRAGRISQFDLLGLSGVCARSQHTRRQFGCGNARYDISPEPGLAVVRTLSVAPSGDTDMGQPAMVVTVQITNKKRQACEFKYTESVLSRVALGIELRTPETAKVVRYSNRSEVKTDASMIISHATAHPNDPEVQTHPAEANRYNLYPASLAMVYPRTAGDNQASAANFTAREVAPGATYLDTTVQGQLKGGETRTLVFVVGLCPDQKGEGLLGFANALRVPKDGIFFGNDWRAALTTFAAVPDKVFRRELIWNSHALLAMATYNSFYGETFIPQGMTYDYQMDLTAAPRDHLQHSLAASYFRPALAKSSIRYVLSKMTEQGEIKYTDCGFGRTSNSAWNTSDQQLYLFQGLGEYLRITGDYAFLDEMSTYLPHQAGMEGPVFEKVRRAMTYLREEVSTGPHGLVRLMNSDWSDMAYADHSVLRYYFTAESHMNSAMVMAVMPNMVRQLQAYAKWNGAKQAAAANQLAASMTAYIDRISNAFMTDLGDRTFSIRLYFDPQTPFGDDNLNIEPQALLLQAEGFPLERKRVLWGEVQKRVLDGEVVGPRQREKPVVGGMFRPFTSENGAYWYTLGGQLIAGLSTFDKPAALKVLRQLTYDNFAKHYPNYWTGLWSAADTVNAVEAGDIAGLPRPENDGLWTTFASYCAHPHAWPIYTWSRIAEA